MRVRMVAGWLLLCALCLAGLAACADDAQVHPMAFFTVGPRFLCQGDDHQTAVRFDARQSSGAAQLLIAGEERGDFGPLSLRWHLDSEAFRIVEGDLRSDLLVLTFAGDRTVQIRLEVTNEAGEQSTAEETIGLVVPTAVPCKEDGAMCDENERCTAYDGALRCLPNRDCGGPDDCPNCYRCEGGQCVP